MSDESVTTTTARELRCPNCDGRMREVERRGIRIDICTECKGVFLDRGELDALIEAIEQVEEYYEQQPPPGAQQPAPAAAAPPPPPAPGAPPGAPLPQAPPGPGGYAPPPAPAPAPGWQQQQPPPQPAYGQPAPYGQPGHGQPGKSGLSEAVELFTAAALQHKMGKSGHHGYGHKRKRKGLLGELFDL